MTPVLKDSSRQKRYVKDYFDKYSGRYHQDHYVQRRPPSIYPVLVVRLRYITAMLSDFNKRGKVIDIGCGTGEMLQVLSERQFHTFELDYSLKMLQAISKKVVKHRVSLLNGEIEDLPFRDECFDGVICAGVIEYLNEDQKALRDSPNLETRRICHYYSFK